MKKYAWKGGEKAKRGIKPEVAGSELKKLCGNKGGVSTAQVVEAARPKSAPLHSWFTWDNTRAADLYRQEEAGMLMRFCVEVQEVNGEECETPVVCYVPSGDSNEMMHVQTSDVMSDTAQREYIIQAALDGLRSWRLRYGMLKELASVVTAIDGVVRRGVVSQG